MTQKIVSLFIQCLVDSHFPDVGMSMVAVFERLGIGLDYPKNQTCCGQPAYNSGYFREAQSAARHFIEVFQHAEVIVCPSGSCVHMVRHHYPTLFADEPEFAKKAVAIGEKTYEFTQYLVEQLGITDVQAEYQGTVTYHDSCHLNRGLGISQQPRMLLEKVHGLTFLEMEGSDTCCGFGGTFSMNYPEISVAMADEKIENILKCGATTVVGCDISCLMHILGRLKRRNENINVMHIAQVLAKTKGVR